MSDDTRTRVANFKARIDAADKQLQSAMEALTSGDWQRLDTLAAELQSGRNALQPADRELAAQATILASAAIRYFALTSVANEMLSSAAANGDKAAQEVLSEFRRQAGGAA